MSNLALQAAGVIGIAAAAVHGILGETLVFARAKIEPAGLRLLLRLVWQCGAIAWIGFGVLLFMAPYLDTDIARHWIIAVAVVVYAAGSVGNAWATGGRHVGWMVLLLASGLALAGW